MPTFEQWEAKRKAAGGNPASTAPDESTGGLMPSTASSVGGMAGGLLGPLGAMLGSGLGSAANELSSSIPKLMEMHRSPEGIFGGPMGTEGVGAAMAEPAKNMALDTLKNAALNKVPGAVGYGLEKGGNLLSTAGNMASKGGWPATATRMAVGPILHSLGLSEAPAIGAELAATVGPAAAKAIGPPMTAAGKAMPSSVLEGLSSAVGKLFPRNSYASEGGRPVSMPQEGPSRYESAQGPVDSPNFQRTTPPPTSAEQIARMNGESDVRTVRGLGNLQQEAPGGLGDVAAGKVRPTPYRPLQSAADKILNATPGEHDIELPHSPSSRLSSASQKAAWRAKNPGKPYPEGL